VRGAASSGGPWDHPRLHRQQTLALHLFAGELAGAADYPKRLVTETASGLGD